MSDRGVIVVGVDGSNESAGAVVWAAREAKRSNSDLRIVHVWHSHTYLGSPFVINPIPEVVREPEQSARADVERARDLARAIDADLAISVCTPGGPSALTLLERAADAQMLVIGGKHRPMLERAVFGSVTTHAVTHAHCPVVVVRASQHEAQRPAWDRGRVVLGYDNSDEARTAAAFAFEYAAGHGFDVTVVEALNLPPGIAVASGEGDDVVGLNRDAVVESMSQLVAQYPDVAMRTVVELGHAVPVILEHARTAEALIVGSRGRGRFEGMLLGSVSAALVHQAPVTLVVVRPIPE